MNIILASASPRRRELLKKVVQDFSVVEPDVNEQDIRENDPVLFAVQASALKAKNVGEKNPSATVIASDTVVSIEGRIIGKPADRKEAGDILRSLSGKKHKVITGIAVYRKEDDRMLTDYDLTYVTFNRIEEPEIEEYLSGEDYRDKAGGYAIQSGKASFVEKIEGDFDNVVGLPVKKVKRLLHRFSLPETEASVSDIAFPNNWAVARAEGKVVFVQNAVYGDRIKMRIVKDAGNFSYGETSRVIEQSPFRVEPPCPAFGKCGGCSFQNTCYEKQAELKERYLMATLKKIGGIDGERVERHPIIPSPDIFYYRNKMEFAFGNEKGKVVLGLRERSLPFNKSRSRIAPLDGCMIFSEAAGSLFPLVRQFAEETGLKAYDPRTGEGFFRHLVMREGKNTGELMLILVTKSCPSFDITRLADMLAGGKTRVASLWWVENDRLSDVVSFEKKNHLLGNPWIEEKMGSRVFRVHLSTFFQPNTRAAGLLYSRIRENLAELGSRRILGLYCGAGAIEISVSDAVETACGIDIEQSNITNAMENCRINSVTNCNFQHSSVEDIFKKASLEEYDTLVLDPPRAGISGKAMKNIFSLKIPSLVYVSCNPAAFARDVRHMEEEGYRLAKLYCADFFPHTPHLESMGVLVRKQ